jgi:hypothetical protein
MKSAYIGFGYDDNLMYKPGSIVTFSGKFYQRSGEITGYSPGIDPSNAVFWRPSNPGRDLGDYSTLSELQSTHPTPAAGSIATVEEDDAFYKWDADNLEWVQVSGNAGQTIHFAIHPDLDNPSQELQFMGVWEVTEAIADSSRITGLQYYFSLNGTFMDIVGSPFSSISGLNGAIAANVPSSTSFFFIKLGGTISVINKVDVYLKMSEL